MFDVIFATGVPFIIKAGVGTLLLMKMLVKTAIFAAVIIFFVRFYKKSGSSSALKILEEKFAAGDINEEEYTKRKFVLTQK